MAGHETDVRPSLVEATEVYVPTLRLLAVVVASLSACGAGAPGWPARLATTVHRVEEQGIDYSAVGAMRFELTLAPDGTGSAIRTTRATDVLGADAHETDATVRYLATARRLGGRFSVALTPAPDSPPIAEAVELVCEPWLAGSRAEGSGVRTPALPGVEWICALPPERTFALDRAALQHVPREGTFLLLGTTRDAVVHERVDGGGREITTSAGE